MIDPTEMLLVIGVEWLIIAAGMLIFSKMRPTRTISLKATVIIGSVLLLIALAAYFVVMIASGLGHSACGAGQTSAAFPLLFTGLFAVPTAFLFIYRRYDVSRIRLKSAPEDSETASSFRLARTIIRITVVLSVCVVAALAGRAGLWPPVMYAVSRNFSEQRIAQLLKLGFSPEATDICGNRPLVYAAMIQNGRLVGLLLDHGVDPNQTGNEYNPPPPLWWAAFRGDVGIAELLINKGANVEGVGSRFPLMAACRNGHLEMVKLLIDRGAQVNSRNVHGTPLSNAAETDQIEVMKYLIEKGANVDGKDDRYYRWTPLMRAAAAGSLEALILLLNNGANPDFKDTGGDTPTSIAQERGHSKVVEFLKKNARNNKPSPNRSE